MKTVMIIMPVMSLPIPDDKGGAIERLITTLIENNEKYNNFNIIVICSGSENCTLEKYKYSDIIQICYDPNGNDLVLPKTVGKKFIYRCNSLLHRDNKLYSFNEMKQYEIASNYSPDVIIFEGQLPGNAFLYKRFTKHIFFHIHHRFPRTKCISKYTEVTIVPSNYIGNAWKADLDDEYKNIELLRNCIDLSRFESRITNKEKNNLKAKIGIEGKMVVLYVGRLIPEKGIDYLLDAFDEIGDRAVLLITGTDGFANGNIMQYSRNIIDRINKMPNAKYIGYIPNEELYKIYQLADIQVVPSVWEEAAGLVVLEGMASKVPLIVTDSGGMVEFVEPDYAYIIQRGDNLKKNIVNALNELMESDVKRELLKEKAAIHVNDYSEQKYYEDFCRIIDKYL